MPIVVTRLTSVYGSIISKQLERIFHQEKNGYNSTSKEKETENFI